MGNRIKARKQNSRAGYSQTDHYDIGDGWHMMVAVYQASRGTHLRRPQNERRALLLAVLRELVPNNKGFDLAKSVISELGVGVPTTKMKPGKRMPPECTVAMITIVGPDNKLHTFADHAFLNSTELEQFNARVGDSIAVRRAAKHINKDKTIPVDQRIRVSHIIGQMFGTKKKEEELVHTETMQPGMTATETASSNTSQTTSPDNNANTNAVVARRHRAGRHTSKTEPILTPMSLEKQAAMHGNA